MAQMITFEREVSIGSPEHGKGPQIKQGDSGITFRVALSVCKPVTQWLGRSEAYPIPAGATAVMRVKKPDGTYTITVAAVDGIHTVIAPLPAEATTSAGEC